MKKLIVLALLLWGFPAFPQMNKTLLNLDKNGVAIQGYDPVAFFTQNKPVKGNAQMRYLSGNPCQAGESPGTWTLPAPMDFSRIA